MSKEECTSEENHVVKVAIDNKGNAIDFFRILPQDTRTFKHIGVYGFSKSVIQRIVELDVEKRELELSLEQLRWLDNGLPIRMIPAEQVPISIDVEESLNEDCSL